MTWDLLGWSGPPSVWFVHGDAPLVVRWWTTNDPDETAFPNGYSYVVLPQEHADDTKRNKVQ